MTMEEEDNQFNINIQCCDCFVTCSGRSGDLLYITFLHSGMSTIGIYPGDIVPEVFYFWRPVRTKMQRMYQNF